MVVVSFRSTINSSTRSTFGESLTLSRVCEVDEVQCPPEMGHPLELLPICASFVSLTVDSSSLRTRRKVKVTDLYQFPLAFQPLIANAVRIDKRSLRGCRVSRAGSSSSPRDQSWTLTFTLTSEMVKDRRRHFWVSFRLVSSTFRWD